MNTASKERPGVRRTSRRLATTCALSLLVVAPSLALPPSATADYTQVQQWGSRGGHDGGFSLPDQLSFDSSGNLWVADSFNQRLQQFTPDGQFLKKIGSYQTQFGATVSTPPKLNFPQGIAAAPNGSLYVADTYNYRVQQIDPGPAGGAGDTAVGNGVGPGSLPGEFNLPWNIAADAGSPPNIYVADLANSRVQKLGTVPLGFVTIIGSLGSGDGQFIGPTGIAVAPNGNIYVADVINNRVQIFNSAGVFLGKFGATGTADGQFQEPYGVAIDSPGNVYVVDGRNYRIEKFDANGNFITKWGSYGTGDNQFLTVLGIAVDSSGAVYVSDSFGYRILKFRDLPPTTSPPESSNPVEITDLKSKNRSFGVGKSKKRGKARKRTKRGTTFTYTLSRDATVTFTVQQKIKGRLVKGKCRRRAKRGKRCKATRIVQTFSRNGKAGGNAHKYTGRIGKKLLRPGRFTLTAQARATDGVQSNTATLNFRVVGS